MNAHTADLLPIEITMLAVNIHRVGMEQPSRACGDNTATSHHCDASIIDDSREAPPERSGVVHSGNPVRERGVVHPD